MKKTKWTFLCIILFCTVYSSFAQKVEYVKISREGGQPVTLGDSEYIGYDTVDQVHKKEGGNFVLYLTAKGKGILQCEYYIYGLSLHLNSPQNKSLEFDSPELLKQHFKLDRSVKSAFKDKRFEGKRFSEFMVVSKTDDKEHLVRLTAEWKLDAHAAGSVTYSAEVIK